MSTSVIEPGTRLAGRYRLETRVSEAGGSTLWKAIDEILARAVAVRTFTPDFPHVNEVVTAARAASRLTDPRLTQVFDADDSDELAYVVSEWVSGETLRDMVSSRGPLEPGRAATLLCEAAEAISAAHASGLAHLKLTSSDLLWTTGGTVKLLGLGVEAALGGVSSQTPALVDAQGLGRMLYLALTGRSVSAEENGLPVTDTSAGRTPAPRTLQPGIPQALDAIVRRTLDLDRSPGEEPLATPAALAKALAGVPRTPLPLFSGLAANPAPPGPPRTPPQRATPPRPAPPSAGQTVPDAGRRRQPPPAAQRPAAQRRQPAAPGAPAPRQAGHGRSGGAASPGRTRAQAQAQAQAQTQAQARTQAQPRAHAQAHGHAAPARPAVNRPLIAIAAAVATVVVGVGAWQLSRMGQDTPSAQPPAQRSTSAPSEKSRVKLPMTVATGVDPAGNDSGKGTAKGALAIDGKTSTDWRSSFYTSADFGRLKGGVGLMIDLGASATVSEVVADLPVSPGAAVKIRLGDSQSVDGMRTVAEKNDAGGGRTSFTLSEPAKGRYVLLWFTKLSRASDGEFRAVVSEVAVHGTPG